MTLGDDFINDELDTDLGQVEDVEDVEDEKHEEANQRSWWDEALHMDQAKSGIRRVFVIMPFSNASGRSSSDLDHHFEDAIRGPMET